MSAADRSPPLRVLRALMRLLRAAVRLLGPSTTQPRLAPPSQTSRVVSNRSVSPQSVAGGRRSVQRHTKPPHWHPGPTSTPSGTTALRGHGPGLSPGTHRGGNAGATTTRRAQTVTPRPPQRAHYTRALGRSAVVVWREWQRRALPRGEGCLAKLVHRPDLGEVTWHGDGLYSIVDGDQENPRRLTSREEDIVWDALVAGELLIYRPASISEAAEILHDADGQRLREEG